jgi:hypothetical protein
VEFSRPFLNRLLLRRTKGEFALNFQQVLAGKASFYQVDHEGNTLLHLAVIENAFSHLQDLLAYGLSPQKQNRWGLSAIDLAHHLGRKAFLPFLTVHQAPPPITIYRNKDQKRHAISLKEFENKLNIDYISYLEFETPDYLRWTLSKSEKQLKKEAIRKMNRWVLALHKKSILAPRYDHIYIRHIDSVVGYGVFANEDLPRLTYIGEYTGVVTRRHPKKICFNDYVFRYMVGPKNTPFMIDAKKKGNFSRFINHSDEPNMNSRWVIVGGITRIILFTNRLIEKGEQLTYDYGKSYWRSRTAPTLIT